MGRFSHALALTSVVALGSAQSSFYTTSDSSALLENANPPQQGAANAPSGALTWLLQFDDTSSDRKQTIDGFGAALTDGSVTSINSLSASTRENLFNDLFKSSSLNFMRHTIGASDMSGPPAYSYDDNNNQPDPNLDSFNLGGRGTDMANMLNEFKSYNSELKILGSPWSAPGWMKLNGQFDPSTTNQNNLYDPNNRQNNNGIDYSSQFGQYFAKYISAYENLGAKPDAITIQNEPYNSQDGYPTMYLYPNEQGILINDNVAPAIGSDTEIWALDHNTVYYSDVLTTIANAGGHLSAVAWHCYSNPDWSVLTDMHNAHPELKQYMTECIIDSGDSYGWGNYMYSPANWTMGPLQNWANGVIAWNLAAYTNGAEPHLSGGCGSDCPGMVHIDQDNDSYQLDLAYYVMSQFSRAIPRGAQVLNGAKTGYTFSDGTGVEAIATVNPDGSRTVVMLNKSSSEYYTTVQFQSGDEWNSVLPADSMMTWTLPGN